MKVTVEMSEEQARVVVKALDIFSRLHMGQVSDVELFYRLLNVGQNKSFPSREVERLCESIKFYVFPELSPGSYHSISSEKISEDARVAFDLIQALRHPMAWKRNPEGGQTVDFYDPMKTAKSPLAKVKVE
jgi:hypothetical protein